MRDPKRIKPFLNQLQKLWLSMPDIRFGQLIYILAEKLDTHDIFFPEDDKWLDAVNQKIKEMEECKQ